MSDIITNLLEVGIDAESINSAIQKVDMAIQALIPEEKQTKLRKELYNEAESKLSYLTLKIISDYYDIASELIENNSDYHLAYNVASNDQSELYYYDDSEEIPKTGRASCDDPVNKHYVAILEKETKYINMPVERLIEILRRGWNPAVGEELCWRAGNINEWDRSNSDHKAVAKAAAKKLGFNL